MNDIAPEYTLSTLAATAPRQIASSVSLPIHSGMSPVKTPGSTLAFLPAAETIAAPADSSSTHDTKMPSPAHNAIGNFLVVGGR